EQLLDLGLLNHLEEAVAMFGRGRHGSSRGVEGARGRFTDTRVSETPGILRMRFLRSQGGIGTLRQQFCCIPRMSRTILPRHAPTCRDLGWGMRRCGRTLGTRSAAPSEASPTSRGMDSPDYKNRTSSTPTRDRRARRIAPHRIGETSIYVFS